MVPGDNILIDDGLVKLRALSTDGRDVRSLVFEGGTVADHKGINLPGVNLNAQSLTDKDRRDLGLLWPYQRTWWRCRSCAGPKTSRPCGR